MLHRGWKKGWLHFMVAFLIVSAGLQGLAQAGKTRLESQLTPLIGKKDAVAVASPDGRILAAIHSDCLLVPASILKVLTSLAALHYLGAEYRFPTDFFATPEGHLIVKGYGDPLLVSERLSGIAAELAVQTRNVDHLLLDDSYFVHSIAIPGRSRSAQPYDAPNGALCVNFNTVSFERRNGGWVSAEPQTPLLPAIVPKIEATGLKSGRITLAADRQESLNYAGELMGHFLREAGVTTQGTIACGTADPAKDRLLWRHYSDKCLTEVIAVLLNYSNNFIANQLLLTIGAQAYLPPGDLDKGVLALRAYYESVLGHKTGFLAEGSGLSRQNRLSADTMLDILDKFAPYHALMRQQGRQYYKTGTLSDVRTRAGYLSAADGGYYRFVVMLNTPGRTTDAVMRVIERELH